ncbi:MAG TPA: L,D-transpeptidase [Chthoniobacteraceae bacterium]|nr:L,D-transpeptidase [Chthoniobacteraceae bacterium]
MKLTRLLSLLALATGAAVLTGCGTTMHLTPYSVTAYKPHNPDKVVVKVSLSTQNVYVEEGDRLLMAVQGNVGKPGASTPSGHFHVEEKIREKRSGEYGFTHSGASADGSKGEHVDVGYPMAFWVGFAPAYGFHQGFVWSEPHTHGCIRLHMEAAARLYALVKIGTPVIIEHSLPEDSTYGSKVRKLDQRNDPNPPTSLLMSKAWFQDPKGPLLIDEQ